MSKRIFTKEQIEQLLENEHVRTCSEKSITYSPAFKQMAVKNYEEGLTAIHIFKEAGFDLNIIGIDVPNDQLKQWRKIHKNQGMEGLSKERRGRSTGSKRGRPKTKGLTDANRIERLEAENAYLKAENVFLAKLRAKRRE